MHDYSWIDRKEYPFKSHSLELEMGRMHYVDEGTGEPLVMVHGNPTWSFVYRHLINGLSKDYRCIAMDHIGFGLSDKPQNWSYYPEDHAKNFDIFIERLDLHNITLVVQDWGGPIGLSYAVNHPENV
ncbi:MAG: alpha/beta fold hydrolase, partial [Nitrospirota bacterium]